MTMTPTRIRTGAGTTRKGDSPLDLALLAAEAELRVSGETMSSSDREDCEAAEAVLESFLPHTHRAGRQALRIADGTIILDEASPLGSVLIVTSPECSAAHVLRNAIGALCAGNRVAVSHHRGIHQAARVVLDSLESSLTAGRLLQFEEEPLALPWSRVSICVLTPSRVFLNDEPWTSWEFDEEHARVPERVIGFYQAHRLTTMTWEAVPFGHTPVG